MGFDGAGEFKKIPWAGGVTPTPHAPPLGETLYGSSILCRFLMECGQFLFRAVILISWNQWVFY